MNERPTSGDDAWRDATGTVDALELQAACHDLVDALSSAGPDGVTRELLRQIVALGLTSGAALWRRGEDRDAPTLLRGFGDAPRPGAGPSTSTQPFTLGGALQVVVRRPSLDLDGRRDDREDAIEALVLVASSLIEPWAHDLGSDGPAGPLPRGSASDAA